MIHIEKEISVGHDTFREGDFIWTWYIEIKISVGHDTCRDEDFSWTWDICYHNVNINR